MGSPSTNKQELEFIHKSNSTVGYRANVFSTTLSHLIATSSPHLLMPFVPIRGNNNPIKENNKNLKTGDPISFIHSNVFVLGRFMIMSFEQGSKPSVWFMRSLRTYCNRKGEDTLRFALVSVLTIMEIGVDISPL